MQTGGVTCPLCQDTGYREVLDSDEGGDGVSVVYYWTTVPCDHVPEEPAWLWDDE